MNQQIVSALKLFTTHPLNGIHEDKHSQWHLHSHIVYMEVGSYNRFTF